MNVQLFSAEAQDEFPRFPLRFLRAAPGIEGWRWRRMELVEAHEIIASYNAFVRVWNVHERSRHLPLLSGSDWPYASLTFCASLHPHTSFTFAERYGERRFGAIAVESWSEFAEGHSFARNSIDASAILWGGWEDRREDDEAFA